MRSLIRNVGLTSFALLSAAPMPSIAQDPAAVVLHACYIPALGVTYRIKEPGLPADCVGKHHVAFSWNQQGPKGDKGDTGERGEQGEPGEPGPGVSAAECPPTSFLTGFTAAGGMICRNASWTVVEPPEPPPPPPFPPSPYDGSYTISPAISKSCQGLAAQVLGSYFGSLSGFTVQRVSETELQITPRLGGLLGGFLALVMSPSLLVPYVDEIAPSIDLNASIPLNQAPFTGTGSLSLQGSLVNATTFSGTVSASVSGSVQTPFGRLDGSCSIAPTNFTATKSS